MKIRRTVIAGLVQGIAATALLASQAGIAGEINSERLLSAHKDPNNWLMYHGSYKAWHYSDLSQINAANVKDMKVACIHTPGAGKRGIQSFPLVADGIMYYTSSNNVVYAVNAASCETVWKYAPKIDEERAQGTFYQPYNRGVAIGYGKVYLGTVDGRMIALDMRTGKPAWDVQLMGVEKGNKGFTGAPLVVKDKVILGANGGELSGCCGPIFAVNAQTGEKAWQFDTVGGDERSRSSWGNESWKIGGGGGWMTGTYDPDTNTIWWGTANPAPDYDWVGDGWKTGGARPGDNLYSSSVVVLDADSGKLKSYFQEMPHDAWDFDSAVGEFMSIDKGGKKYMVHPNKGGIIFAYNRGDVNRSGDTLKVENAYMVGKTFNYIKGVTKDGQLIGRRELPEGKHKGVCPAIDGAISWNTGAYNPNTGLIYKAVQEFCFDIEVVKAPPPPVFSGQAYFGANWTTVHPEGTKAFGHVSGRDPITGEVKWEVLMPEPALASLLTTKGNLLFVPDPRGHFRALDARTGEQLWSHNNGLGHHGGVITYTVNGKQYVAVVTGWGSHVSGNFAPLWGEPWLSMPGEGGNLIVFALP